MLQFIRTAIGLVFLLTASVCLTAQTSPKKKTPYPDPQWESYRTDAGTCLIRHAADSALAELLPDTTARKVAGATSTGEVSYNREWVPLPYQMLQYSFPGTRTTKMAMGDRVMDVAVLDQVGIGGVRTMDPNAFASTYRTMTKDEIDDLQRRMEAGFKNMPDTGTTQRQTPEMLISQIKKGLVYEPVSGIGDKAVFDVKTQTLIVLTGDVIFSVLVNVDDTWQVNLKKALPIAEGIFKQCSPKK